MKEIENQITAAVVMRRLFEDKWKGFVFEKQATLVNVARIPEGPVWMLTAEKAGKKMTFVWETVTQYAYVCPVEFIYSDVRLGEVFDDCLGRCGTVIMYEGVKAIVYD